MNIIRFEHIEMLFGLLLVPVFVILFLTMLNWRKRKLNRFVNSQLLRAMMPAMSKRRVVVKFILLTTAYVFLVIGLANPQVGSKIETSKRKGIDLIVALDVSTSMLAEDIRPNRLTRAKYAITQLVDKLEGDRVGIIIFAGKAFTQLPITTDYNAARMFISNINTHLIPSQGTAIGEAIQQAMKSFDMESGTNKSLVIITDGENHEDGAIEMAAQAAEQGIVIHCIGMGSPEGAPIPVKKNVFKKDRDGNTIVTRLDEITLQKIATAGHHGRYIRATNKKIGLKTIFEEISGMEKSEIESRNFTDFEDRFQYFIGVALLLLLLELCVFERKSIWSARINLFKVNTL